MNRRPTVYETVALPLSYTGKGLTSYLPVSLSSSPSLRDPKRKRLGTRRQNFTQPQGAPALKLERSTHVQSAGQRSFIVSQPTALQNPGVSADCFKQTFAGLAQSENATSSTHGLPKVGLVLSAAAESPPASVALASGGTGQHKPSRNCQPSSQASFWQAGSPTQLRTSARHFIVFMIRNASPRTPAPSAT